MNDTAPEPNSPEQPDPAAAPSKERWFWPWFWRVFLVASLGYAWYSFYAPANDIAWAADAGSAQQQAARSGKTVMLFFTGKWCSPCQIMKRQVWADPEVAAVVNEHLVAVMVDVDEPAKAPIVSRYGIGATPVTLLTDPEGNALAWRVGKIGKAEFLDLLDERTGSTNDG
ncbi:MAG: thioredoxin family protein [Acidobacteriota bacterium]